GFGWNWILDSAGLKLMTLYQHQFHFHRVEKSIPSEWHPIHRVLHSSSLKLVFMPFCDFATD
ncbi:hypothetical protein, partial [uncultured Marinobacter sp.]|uniref:hypothetical protein n=1 Tax=uncultured Marinobacter sp. TaxID=187379 RepID=UPI0030D975A2